MDKGVTAMIGETVLVYQAVEHLMKRIAQVSDISAPLSRFKASCEKRAKHVASSTMGGVVEDFLQILEPLIIDEDERITETCFRMKFEVVTDADERRIWSERTRALVADRNWLIHQSRFDLEEARTLKANIRRSAESRPVMRRRPSSVKT